MKTFILALSIVLGCMPVLASARTQTDVACFFAGQAPVTITDVKKFNDHGGSTNRYDFSKDGVNYTVPVNACMVRSFVVADKADKQ